MEVEFINTVLHTNSWHWGTSVDIITEDGKAMVCVKFDKDSSPKCGYICSLSVHESQRKNGLGWLMMNLAIKTCREHNMDFARLHVDIKKIWLQEWYQRMGFKELSRDENELEMVKEL